MDELRLILLGIGLLVIGLIYAWGMRARIRERFRNRRREPGLDDPDSVDPGADAEPDVWSRPDVRVVQPAEQPERSVARSREEADEAVTVGPEAPDRAEPASTGIADKPVPPTVSEVPKTEPVSRPTQQAPGASRQSVRRTPEAPAGTVTGKSSGAKAPTWNVLLTLMAPEKQPYTGNAIRAAAEQQQLVLAERGVWECLTGDGSEQMIFGVGHLREPGTFDPAQLDALRTPGLLLFMPLPGPLEAVPAVDLMIEQAGQLQRRLGGVLCDERRNRLTAQSLIRLRTRADEFDQQMQAYSATT